MGTAIIDRATGHAIGWSRWGTPPEYDAERHELRQAATFDAAKSAAQRLEEVREAAVAAVLRRTAALREAGFEYSGRRFGLSWRSQANWTSLAAKTPALPFVVHDSDLEPCTLADAAELEAFLAAALERGAELVSGEADLLRRIAAATSIDELEQIADERAA